MLNCSRVDLWASREILCWWSRMSYPAPEITRCFQTLPTGNCCVLWEMLPQHLPASQWCTADFCVFLTGKSLFFSSFGFRGSSLIFLCSFDVNVERKICSLWAESGNFALFCTVILPNIFVFSIRSQYVIEDWVLLLFYYSSIIILVCQYSVHPGAMTPTGAQTRVRCWKRGEKH